MFERIYSATRSYAAKGKLSFEKEKTGESREKDFLGEGDFVEEGVVAA